MKIDMKQMFVCLLILVGILVNGCSIIAASKLPLARPLEHLQEGTDRAFIDSTYGFPTAVGYSADGANYIEQIQFVDGIPIGWKIFRICSHVVLDDVTIFLWEFIGWPIELMNSSYPEYVYFVIYDDANRIVRAVPQNSEEGRKLSELPWTARRQPRQSTNRNPTIYRPSISERIQKRK